MLEIILANLLPLSPIMALSLLSTAIMVERFFYSLSVRENPELIRRAGGLYTQGKNEAALEVLSQANNSAERAILRYTIENRFILDELLRSRLEIIARNRLALMEKNVAFLSTIANIATLTGLLGTVVGMIQAFAAMNASGSSDPFVIAGGIGSALITTAAGLMVAIPSLLAYHWFAEGVARKADHLDSLIAEVLTTKGARL